MPCLACPTSTSQSRPAHSSSGGILKFSKKASKLLRCTCGLANHNLCFSGGTPFGQHKLRKKTQVARPGPRWPMERKLRIGNSDSAAKIQAFGALTSMLQLHWSIFPWKSGDGQSSSKMVQALRLTTRLCWLRNCGTAVGFIDSHQNK